MSASKEELIAINSLLIEREAAFAHVHTLEAEIAQFLDTPYPFEAPAVQLPSSIKKKLTKTKKAKKKAALKPRRLVAHEVGYRLTWLDKGKTTEQTITDLRSIEALLKESLPGTKLLKIETIDLSGTTIQTLFPESP